MEHDISLILTNEKIKFSAYAQPIALASTNDNMPELTKAVASGWGLRRVSLVLFYIMNLN